MSNAERFHGPEPDEDPLAGDVDRFVHPDETRTDEQIAHDEKYAVEPYGDDPADEYWAEYEETHGEKPPEQKVEEKYNLTDQDVELSDSASTWLEDAAAEWERERADDFDGQVSHYSGDERSGALYRVLENGFYATSDDNVYDALRTVQTGNLRRAGHFSTWQDGRYKAAQDIENSELDVGSWREFSGKFAELQRQREEALSKGEQDPLQDQMQVAFEINEPVSAS